MKLAVSHRANLRLEHHLIHHLDIVVAFVHLVLDLGQQVVVAKVLGLDFDGGGRLTLPVIFDHALFPRHSHGHLLLLLFVHHPLLLLEAVLVLDEYFALDAVEVALPDHADL